MPKNFEVEFNAMDRNLIEEEMDEITEGQNSVSQGKKQLSKKELGKLKSRKALLENDMSKAGDGNGEERMMKKSRSKDDSSI